MDKEQYKCECGVMVSAMSDSHECPLARVKKLELENAALRASVENHADSFAPFTAKIAELEAQLQATAAAEPDITLEILDDWHTELQTNNYEGRMLVIEEMGLILQFMRNAGGE